MRLSPLPWRRAATTLLCAALTAWTAGTATSSWAGAAAADDLAAVEVAAGVYLVPGMPGEPGPSNQGRTGNAGFIVGPTGVIAVDTGTSYRHGMALLAAIRRVTDQPVRLALITHPRQEFLFGAAAFRERGIPIAMQRRAAGLMTSRCDTCLQALRRELGAEAMRGTEMWKPDQVFDDTWRIDLIGRPVQALYFGHSSGPGDIAVLDSTTQVLFAGGLLDAQRIPDIGDSDLTGWRLALGALHALGLRQVVPGHGPVVAVDPQAMAALDVERYLDQLEARVRGLMKADVPLSEIPTAADLPEFNGWDQYATVHRRNAATLFLRLERDQFYR